MKTRTKTNLKWSFRDVGPPTAGKGREMGERCGFDYMAPIHKDTLSYQLMVAELNELDHFCTYTRKQSGSLHVLYRRYFMAMTRVEAQEKLELLRMIRGCRVADCEERRNTGCSGSVFADCEERKQKEEDKS